ncbi:CDGSH iron-sulfur domain-containing protein [Arthrobacter sp. Helios]|uniref:CDGSH iron-sulfur domain-containing protein n=1 Tax=Arthrobacter sp. Helios TaxID=2828862 RepID=UPI0032C102A0
MSSTPAGKPVALVEATGVSVSATTAGREGTAGNPAPVSVMACPGGPLLVRGDFEVFDAEGNLVPKNRETVALCRCAGSKIKPWCDGTHKLLKHGSATD